MDFFEESKKIENICLMLHEREVKARKKEKEEFDKLTEEEKEVYIADKKNKEKIRKNEEKRIYNSKHFKTKYK